jgi:hypothetical protein
MNKRIEELAQALRDACTDVGVPVIMIYGIKPGVGDKPPELKMVSDTPSPEWSSTVLASAAAGMKTLPHGDGVSHLLCDHNTETGKTEVTGLPLDRSRLS